MAEDIETNQLPIEEVIITKPNKKRHIWWRILLAILVVIITPVALVYGLLFDSKTGKAEKVDNFNMQQFGANAVIDGFSYTKSDKKFSIRMGEMQLNSLLYDAKQKIPDAAKQFIPKVYCEIDVENNEYNFYVDGEVPMFKTRVCLCTKLTDYGDYLEFKITDVKAGRIGGLDWVVKKYVPKSTIEDVFKNTGLSFKFDLENMCLTYSKNDMLKDMTTMMGGVSQSDNLFVSLFNQLNELNLITAGSGNDGVDNYLALDVNLESLAKNANYVRTDETLMHAAIKGSMNDAINEMKEDPNSIDSTAASSIVQHIIDELPIVEYAKTNYGASYLQEEASKKSEDGGPFTVNVIPDMADPRVEGITYVTREQIDNFILSTGIVGKTTGFYNKDSKKFAYITINDMYANIRNGAIDFVITLDMNGLDTFIIMPTSVVPTTNDVNYKLDLQIGNILLGENEVSTSDLANKLMNEYLKPALSSGDGLLKVSDDNKTLTLDFEKSYKAGMSNYPALSAYTNVTKFAVSSIGTDKDDNAAYIGVEFIVKTTI